MTKSILRRNLKTVLEKIDSNSLAHQSELITQAIRTHAFYKRSKTVAFYMNMDTGEVQTLSMIANAFKDGKRVFLPHIVKYTGTEYHPWFPGQKTHLKMLEMPDFDSVLALHPLGKYKLKEPTSGLDCLGPSSPGLDLLVLPGVGFTKTCGRLGHGAGYYDSFIAEHEFIKKKSPLLVGVGLQEQLVEPSSALPMADHDRLLDSLIIGRDIYYRSDVSDIN